MELDKEQKLAVETKKRNVLVAAAAGSGKCIPDYCEIPTYNKGLKKVSDIKIGDLLIDRKGSPTKVIGVFPQKEEKEIVKIHFNDGRIAECCEEHLWNIQYKIHKGVKYKTVSVKEMIDIVNKKGYKKQKDGYILKIQVNEPVKYYKKDLKIDPYVLGLFLGDGSFRESTLHFYTNDYELVEKIEQKTRWTAYRYKDDKHIYRYQFRRNTGYLNPINTSEFLTDYPELVNSISYEKFIPEDYKFSSIEQRYELIQGLMDTDGYVDERGRCSYTSTSLILIKDMEFILRSLGFIVTIEEDKRDKYTLGICYTLHIQGKIENKKKLFKLSRKLERFNNLENSIYLKDNIAITKIEKTGIKTKMTCFLVDNDEHLFLMNDYIVTHNTRVITERLKFLLDSGVDESKIFAITYTNAAAQEMRERIGNSEVFIGTIHSLANRILLLNGVDTTPFLNDEEFDRLFEAIKDNNIELPEVEHLLIDEFQDICENEYEFTMETLKPRNFFVVGDSRQAIYSFKGANYKYFMDLINNPFVQVYELNNNYRCGEEIISYAQIFLDNMYDIYDTPVYCKSGIEGEVERVPFSLDTILEYLKEGNYKDWFILCRKNSEIEDISYFLEKKKIPYTSFKKSELSLEELNEKVEANIVKVLTVHSAKGLESKNVIVVGLRNWNQEEKRVCYVAATRAKERLIWMNEVPKRKTNYKMQNWG